MKPIVRPVISLIYISLIEIEMGIVVMAKVIGGVDVAHE
jgi:hypothetical protein